jgi:TorA maturation chaperone TorD
MDRAWLEEHLAQAEMHVAEGEDHVARQQDIVADLANDGHDLKSAQALLAQLERMLANHVADRDRIRAELAAMK